MILFNRLNIFHGKLASKDVKIVSQNASAMVDLDSSVEDSLSLAAIKRCGGKSEESGSQDVVTDKAKDRNRSSDSKVLECTNELADSNEKRSVEAEPHSSFVSNDTGTEKEPVGVRRSPRKGKRKRQIDLEDIESETIESIFNSPDNPTDDSKKSKNGDISFEILESGTVEMVATTDRDEQLKEKVVDLLNDITGSPTRTRSPRKIVQYRQYPLRQKIEPSGATTAKSDDLLPEEPKTRDDIKKSDVMKDDVITSDVIKDDVMTSDVIKSDIKKEKKQGVKIAFMLPHMTASSPSASKRKTGSPTVSPISGILKRRLGERTESPSPPNKVSTPDIDKGAHDYISI